MDRQHDEPQEPRADANREKMNELPTVAGERSADAGAVAKVVSLTERLRSMESDYERNGGAFVRMDRSKAGARPEPNETDATPSTNAAEVPLAPVSTSSLPSVPIAQPPAGARASVSSSAATVAEATAVPRIPGGSAADAARADRSNAPALDVVPPVALDTASAGPVATTGGPGGGGRPPSGSGGSGGGGRNAAPLQSRYSDKDFREVLGQGLAVCRRNLITVGLFSVAVNLLALCIPIYLFQVSDRVLTSRSIDTLVMLSIVVVGAIAAHVLLDMMRRFILMRIAVEVEAKLGAPVLSAAAKASQAGSSREFQTLADLQHLRNFITGPVLLTMFDSPVTPVYLLVVFMVHPHLGFIVTAAGVLLMAIALINQRVTAVPFARANAYGTRANLQADAMARNAHVMNAMGMVPEGVLIWGRETVESLKAQVLAQDRNIVMASISKFARLCTQVAILGWGAWLAVDGRLTGGMIIAASIVAGRALAPLEGTIEGWRGFVHARAAYARIKALLQNSTLNLERLRLPRPQGRLTVERILYVPPPNKRVILNGVSFSLEPGESLAIVGASGTGKSTLAKMLVGSIIPTAGNVRLDMMELRNWDPRQFGESVGYLPQDVQLFPATIKANIARMREDVTDAAIFDAADIADVHEMISQFAQGYETVVAMDGSPLSGGQKQRIGLARAFFGNPRLVVLDEPNSNLDPRGDRALAQALVRAKERRITVVAITQRPSLLSSVDKILLLKDGAVQALGPRDDILAALRGRKGEVGAPGDGPVLEN